VVGGYDGYLGDRVADAWPDPEVVVRLGASPTSKRLRTYLAATDARQFVVDPAAGWREAEFTATDHVVADPARAAEALARAVQERGGPAGAEYRRRWTTADEIHREIVAEAVADGESFEGRVLADVAEAAPEPTTLFVSNSMPVRDLDRFAPATDAGLTVLGNRGASGIDGITSTALGAGSATTDELTLVTGDLAYYHDMNGLLALGRCDVDATVVVIDNDGGGIFHKLPIESFDPPFTEQFKTPHGLDFSATEELYDLTFEAVGIDEFHSAYVEATGSPGTTVLAVELDAEASHRTREAIRERVVDRVIAETT
jgi:2-succinyl-5-enolpyruvyl-6-hydroxy-3-cyclohexene-1-carboxylate synthase